MSTLALPAAQHALSHSSAAPPQPGNLTREHLQQVLAVRVTAGNFSVAVNPVQLNISNRDQKFQQMKSAGVREDDPEYVKARNLLLAVSQRQQMQKQRQLFQHQYPPENSAGQQPAANGLTPPVTSIHNGQPSVSPSSRIPSATSSNQVLTSPFDEQEGGTRGPVILSEEQKKLLRSQVLAFKLLSTNVPIPSHLQREIFPSQQAKKSPTPMETIHVPNQTLGLSSSDSHSKMAALNPSGLTPPKRRYETFNSPYKHFSDHINYPRHGSKNNRMMLIPSIMPPGVDVDKVRLERETIICNRMLSRKIELQKLPARFASWDTSTTDTPRPDSSVKTKALIEYKMLCLLPKQRLLRQQISREMVQADNLVMTANRSLYRRQKKQSLRESRITEKLEKQQREVRETKEKKKQVDYLKAILEHANEIQKSAQDQRAKMQRLGRIMVQHHQTIEKEEQKRVERTAKQRLQALKANDEETYLKLLGQAKDSRISHLLKQTDGFLNQLATSVKTQQRSSAARWDKREAPPEELEVERLDDDDEEGADKRVDYYEVAHKMKEEVKIQSSNLVGGTLKDYQLKGLQWMISLYNNNLNGILADEMGLGKTIQTISLITYLIEKKRQFGPFLVIVPLSTLTNWTSEFDKWAPSVQKIVYKGLPTQRKTAQNQIRYGQFQVLLTTYEYIIKDRPILSKVKWLHMIVDEGHRMKNAKSKLSQTITQYYTTRYRIILTGTPLQNNLPELWALLNFVLPTIFKSVKSFDEWFNTPFANTGSQDKMDLTEEEQILVIRRLHKVLRPFLLRRLKKDVEKDLPDKQERVIKCSFSALQAKLYKQLVTHNKLVVSDGKGGKTGMRGLSNMLMQLRKLCNHPFVFQEVEDQINPGTRINDLLWRTAGKFELLDRILPKFQATGHRVLMFFQMTQIMNIMEDFMELRGIKFLRLDGGTKSEDRADLLTKFNAENSEYFCFLLSTRAGGLGLNLQTADTVIIFDSDWNPHQDLQAQDRAHRIGQKNEVRILRLISSNSVEEKILERAQFKLDMDGKVIQAGKFDNKSTNEERDAMLRVMLESVEAVENNLETEEMDDDELNMLMMRSENEMEVFQHLDNERAEKSPYGPGKKFPRLLGENELPDIYMSEDNPVVENIDVAVGRGARERIRVKYDDGLTEEQWLEAVDNDEDTVEAAVARKDAKMVRRANRRDKRIQDENSLDSPAPDRDSSQSPQPKKRARRPFGREKRKVDDASLDSEPVGVSSAPHAKKRGRQTKITETLTSDERTATQKVLNTVYEALMDLEEPPSPDEPDLQPRGIIDPFIQLPPKADYPDYYILTKEPICMKMVEKRINRKEYQSLGGLWADVRLLCGNCRGYNEDGSTLFGDANLIEEVTLSLLCSESAANPKLGRASFVEGDGNRTGSGRGNDDSTPALGSTSSVSGVGTPAAGKKLKLNFGRRGESVD